MARDLRGDRRADENRVLALDHRGREVLRIHHVADAPARKAVRLRQRVQRDRVRRPRLETIRATRDAQPHADTVKYSYGSSET